MSTTYNTDVCVAGGGPAGMVLGLLLVKLGVKVLVCEHHQDFQREYRGEVLMPRFTQMFRQIGLFEIIEKSPHLKLTELEGYYRNGRVLDIHFQDIAPEAPFAIWMPQPILLNALLDQAKHFSNFEMWFGARVEGLIQEEGVTKGMFVHKEKENETVEVKAKVTVGTDGRFSTLRKRGKFELEYEDHTFDLLWFSIPKPPEYDNHVRFFFSPESNYLILPKYPDSIQCGLVIPKDGYAAYLKRGIESLRGVLLKSHPLFHQFASELKNFSPFNVLQAKIEYVKKWARHGLILVGDSAHTCSPAGAIGVSVAVATAIVAADVIYDCIKQEDYSENALSRVQKMREREVRHIQTRQKAFSRLLLPAFSWFKILTPTAFFLLTQSGLFKKLQRDLMVMKKPLPIRPELSFRS